HNIQSYSRVCYIRGVRVAATKYISVISRPAKSCSKNLRDLTLYIFILRAYPKGLPLTESFPRGPAGSVQLATSLGGPNLTSCAFMRDNSSPISCVLSSTTFVHMRIIV